MPKPTGSPPSCDDDAVRSRRLSERLLDLAAAGAGVLERRGQARVAVAVAVVALGEQRRRRRRDASPGRRR